MEREDEGKTAVKTGSRGGQGSPRTVVPSGRQAVPILSQMSPMYKNPSYFSKIHINFKFPFASVPS
jgi:hypothetical protein